MRQNTDIRAMYGRKGVKKSKPSRLVMVSGKLVLPKKKQYKLDQKRTWIRDDVAEETTDDVDRLLGVR